MWGLDRTREAAMYRKIVVALLITNGLVLSTLQASGQVPANATSLDGTYVGTAAPAPGRGGTSCNANMRMEMTVSAGHVVIMETDYGKAPFKIMGSVNAGGEVSASYQLRNDSNNPFLTISGTIRNSTFTGSRVHGPCNASVEMVKQ
jgi:hypothetical protein